MSVAQIKQELHKFIDIADPKLLAAIYAMMENYLQNDDSIVAFTTDGTPLTKAELVKNIQEAYNEVQKGNFITSEELKEQMKNW
jgi:hypothetical protein